MPANEFLQALQATSIPISWSDKADPAYPRTLFWSHGIDHLPLAIVQTRNVVDIQLALRVAAEHNVRVGVTNAGGHDSRGRAIAPGLLCLDMKHFRNVSFDESRMELHVGGGCNFEDIVPHLPEGYEVSMGTIKSVGVSGLYTTAGYGYITHIVGMAVDLLVGATMVLADGQVKECDDEHHQDLMWCLRGGGGGFGVITEHRIKVVKLPKMLHASITWPLSQREAVHEAFKVYQELLEEFPDKVSIFARASTIPGVGAILGLAATFHGGREEGESAVDRLTSIPQAKVLKRDWLYFKDMLDPMAEKAAPRGGYYHVATQSLARLSPKSADAIVDAILGDSHGKIIIHDMHGAPCRRKPSDTAFAIRVPHVSLFIVGAAGLGGEEVSPELRAQTERWANNLGETLREQPEAIPGGIPSLLHPDETKRVEDWFGPNAERLKEMRHRLDPEGRFRGAVGDMSVDTSFGI